MQGFNYMGGRSATSRFRASVVMPTGKDMAFWDALTNGLVTAGQTGDFYYTSCKLFVVSLSYKGQAQHYGVVLQEESPHCITLKDPDGGGYFKWVGRLLKKESLINSLSSDTALYRAVQFQGTLPASFIEKVRTVEKRNQPTEGRRVARQAAV
jgi:hypothetical protein